MKNLASAPWLVAAVISWGIALAAVSYLNEPLKLDYLWAALCLLGAVYVIFRNG